MACHVYCKSALQSASTALDCWNTQPTGQCWLCSQTVTRDTRAAVPSPQVLQHCCWSSCWASRSARLSWATPPSASCCPPGRRCPQNWHSSTCTAVTTGCLADERAQWTLHKLQGASSQAMALCKAIKRGSHHLWRCCQVYANNLSIRVDMSLALT